MVHGYLCFFYPLDCSFLVHDGVDGMYPVKQKAQPEKGDIIDFCQLREIRWSVLLRRIRQWWGTGIRKEREAWIWAAALVMECTTHDLSQRGT